MKSKRMLRPEKPWLHLLVAPEADARTRLESLSGDSGNKPSVRIVHGRRVATKAALMSELAAALQFPGYCGDNWDALDECLADLEWLPSNGYIILICDANHLLEKETPEQLHILLQILEKAGREWAHAGAAGTERVPKAFHTVLQCGPEYQRAWEDRFKAARVSWNLL
jgi:hypothetical protein